MKPRDTIVSIGRIKTPYKTIKECPNNISAAGAVCRIELKSCYQEALKGLTVDQEILLLYWLGDAGINNKAELKEASWAGLFSNRSPLRPNPIGVAVLPIDFIHENIIVVTVLDCLDGTQLLDIKPAILKELSMRN